MNFYEQLEKGRYGSFELKKQVGPNLLKGFVFSLLLLSTFAASPLLLNLLQGDQPPPKEGPVYSGPPPRLISIDLKPPKISIGRPIFNPPAPKNPGFKAVDPSDIDTLTMVLPPNPSPGRIGKGDSSEQGEGGSESGYDTSLFAGNVIPDDFVPPETDYIPHEIEPIPLDINPQPGYPPLALTTGMTGKVTVKVYVDKTGMVKQWKIVKATPADLGFDDEVLKVIPRWKFTPAVQSGKAVGVWVAIPFKFTLKR
jgi:TonB family protein